MFGALEDQLCSFSPGSSELPDRMDALVWAFTDLMVMAFSPPPFVVPEIVRVTSPSFGPFASAGPSPWSGSHAAEERAYGDRRQEGFSIRR